MSSNEGGETFIPKNSKPTLTVSLCSIFTILSNQIKDPITRQIFLILASPFGFFVAFLIKLGLKEFNNYRACREIKRIIADLKNDLKKPGISRQEFKDISKEIATYQKMLHKQKLDNVKIDIDIQ